MTEPDQQQNPLAIEEVKQHLDRLDKDVKELAKQYKSIQVSLNAIYEDRDLLTDIANDIDKVRGLIIASDKHNETLTKEVADTVEKKTEQVKAEVQVTSHEVKNTVVQKVVHNIEKSFHKEDSKLVKRPWWKRLIFRKKASTVTLAV